MPGTLEDAFPTQMVDFGQFSQSDEQTKALEQALKESQANLQAALEEAQTTNEELQATNEELMAANEELQSTNEELQSVNEELHTVNAEYQLKIDELAALNADIDNLLSSTQIGTIFLDKNRRIRRFTAAIEHQFDLLPTDIGRPLDHLAGKFKEQDQKLMNEHIIHVLAGGNPTEREIQTRDGRFYLKRIYPFINTRHEIGGVVLTFVNITLLKQAQERLEQSDKLLKHTEQTAHVGSWEMDIVTGDSLWSDEFFRICGYEPDAFAPTAEKWLEIIMPDDREKASQAVEKAIKEHIPYSIEKRVVRPDGEIRHVLSRGEITLDHDGNPKKLRGSFTDFTKRKLAEEALVESEQQFSIFFHNTPTGLSITAPDGKLLNINEAFANLLGYTVEEMQTLNFADITHPDDLAASWELIETLIDGQENTLSVEKRYFTKKGDIIWTNVSTTLHRNAKGEPTYFLTTIIDITQTKKRQEIQALFENIFNTNDDIAFFINDQYVYQAVNVQYLNYWQAKRKNIVGKTVAEIIGTENFENLFKPNIDLSLQGKVVRRQMEFDYPSVGKRFMDVTYSPVRQEDNRIIGATIHARDITEMKQNETQLSTALEELSQSNAYLEQFAYAASHDLQEPLNTIANYTSLLQEDYADQMDEIGLHCVQVANGSALRMKEMIAGLLNYSRLRQDGLSHDSIHFESLMTKLMLDLQAKLEDTETQVTFDGSAEIVADAAQLRTLLQNLILNGIKFHKPGTQPQIWIQLKENTHNWLFSIKDNGIGIADKDQKIIFDIFRQLHTREEYPGTGLGLAICHQIVDLHGGKIWCESKEGEGSTFFFTIPKQARKLNYD